MPTVTRGSFAYASTSLLFNTGGWRQMRPEHRGRHAPCATACPAGETPRDYLAHVANGDLRAAWENLVAANPMPAITGRVCHHPCETQCNRGSYDESIAIHSVERFLGDRAIEENWPYPIRSAASDAPEVAVVGAGPAGFSAAYRLIRGGLKVTIFDSEPQPGGLLRSALPPYRLPREVLDRELERLLATGIAFRPNTRIGRNVSIEELQQGFSAIFLAPGTGRHRSWSVDGVEPGDLRCGLDFLKEWISIGEISAHGKIAIVGGGNTAIDLARVLKFTGAAEVHIITFQALPEAGVGKPPADVMSATPREIHQALEEGVIVHDHRGVKRLLMRGGDVVGLEMVHMRELDEGDGKRKLVSFEGTETVLKVDRVIPAVGQQVDPAGFENILGRAEFFKPDHFGRLDGHRGIFVGGDARGAGGSVAGAIGDGHRAAMAIQAYLRGSDAPHEKALEPIACSELNLSYFDHSPRVKAPILDIASRSTATEIEGAISREGARAEASRCFSCGECMSCDNCWTLCPDNAVLKVHESAKERSGYVFDYDHCKGCGICARECPVGFITMINEP
ncbi:MAG TPA: FAD-dependent oxidoreductase [Candidatus Binataceae bacterium]|nr:FAD-dependent oxidoreductase [Candidatus Binataceae bacterium]